MFLFLHSLPLGWWECKDNNHSWLLLNDFFVDKIFKLKNLFFRVIRSSFIHTCPLAVAGKFKKRSKNLGSVLKRCVYDVRTEKFQKKFGLNWRFPWRVPAKTYSLGFGSAIGALHVICKVICRPKKFHPVCLTFDPLGLQMTTIAQNDWNLLRILNF